jgi:hypothetical protein
MSQPQHIIEAKPEDIHAEQHMDEKHDEDKHEPIAEVQLKSTFDSLTAYQAITTFKRSVWICVLAGFCAATDGESTHSHFDPKVQELMSRFPASNHRKYCGQ